MSIISKDTKIVLNGLLSDLSEWRSIVPAMLHPFRAVALARNLVGISAENVAKQMGISRSYLAALENYYKPITSDAKYFFKKLFSSKKEKRMEDFQEIFGMLVCVDKIDEVIKYFTILHNMFLNLELEALNLIFKSIATLKSYFEILEDSSGQAKIIIANNKSILPAYLFNLISVNQVVSYYQNIEPFVPVVLFDRESLNRSKYTNLSLISGIFAFFFTEVRLNIKHGYCEISSCLLNRFFEI